MTNKYKSICKITGLITGIIIFSSSALAAAKGPTVNATVSESLKTEAQINIAESKLIQSPKYKFYLDGKRRTISDTAIRYNNSIYLSLRAVSELLNAKVNYHTSEKAAVIELKRTKVEVPLNSIKVIVYKNRVYVPIRFLSEVFDLTAVYVNKEQAVYFSLGNKVAITPTDVDSTLNDKKDTRVEIVYDGSENYNYLKSIKIEDIRKFTKDIDGKAVELEYAKNQIVFNTHTGIPFSEVKEMLKKYDGVIVGYVADLDLYQVEFTELTYEQLRERMEDLRQEEIVEDDGVFLNYARHFSNEDN